MEDFDYLFKFWRFCDDSILKEKFNLLYSKLCVHPLFLDEYRNFINTGIIGICDDFDFCLYKDYRDTNRLCVVVYEKNNINKNDCSVIFLDSSNFYDYFENCTYYGELIISIINPLNSGFFYSSSCVGEELYKNCTFKVLRSGIKRCVSFCEEEEKYKCLMSINDKTGKSEVVYEWDNYESFLNNNNYTNIYIWDSMNCFCSSLLVTCNDSSSCYNIRDCKSLENKALMLGFCDDFSVFRCLLEKGILIHGFVLEIVNEYINSCLAVDDSQDIRKGQDVCNRSLIKQYVKGNLNDNVSNS